jgi:hypothetical protein
MSNNIIDLADVLQYQIPGVRVHSDHRLVRRYLCNCAILVDLPELGSNFVGRRQVKLNQLVV